MARRIAIVAHPGALGVDVLGVCDLLELANKCTRVVGNPAPFEIELATYDGAPIRMGLGRSLGPVQNAGAIRGPIDSLIVVGNPESDETLEIPAFVEAVREVAGRSRRVLGIGTGARVLGAAGLLDGSRCTTHWVWGRILVTRHFVDDGDVWTAAGGTSGTDLLLALVERDVGPETARHVAHLLFLYRSGTETRTPFTDWGESSMTRLANRDSMRALQQYINDNPAADLTMNALARRTHLSRRHLARVFRAETGTTPHQFVESARLQTARRLLAETTLNIEIVAARSGFGHYENLRRVFSATLGVSPKEYRLRFGPGPAPPTDFPQYEATAT